MARVVPRWRRQRRPMRGPSLSALLLAICCAVAAQDGPSQAERDFHTAQAHYLGGRPREALALFRSVRLLVPDNAFVGVNMGASFLKLGRLEEAVAVLRESAAMAPDSTSSWSNLGAAYVRTERWGEAEEALMLGYALDPTQDAVVNNLGSTMDSQHRLHEAIHWYSISAGLPEHGDADHGASGTAATNLATVLPKVGRAHEAEYWTRRALALSPNNGQIHYNAGVHLRSGARLRRAEASHHLASGGF